MASIGLRGLDEVKGFPQPGLTVCFGGPGCGKTILALSFMQECVTSNEKGVFVSFVEGRDKLLEYAGLLGYDLKGLESQGIVKIVEMPTLSPDSMEAVLKSILDQVRGSGAKRLVLDSFSAISYMIKGTDTVRGFLHNIFTKVLRGMGVTTLITLEQHTREHLPSVEEYVADAVLELRQNLSKEELFTRELTIHKFRGAYLAQKRYAYTLNNGFTVFPPIKKPVEEAMHPEVMREKEGIVSTGMPKLDQILGGGMPLGSYILILVRSEAPLSPLTIASPMIFQSISKGRGVSLVPPQGASAPQVRIHLLKGLTEDQIDDRARIYDWGGDVEAKYAVNLTGEFEKDFETIWKTHLELKERLQKPVLGVAGLDTLFANYGKDEVLAHIGKDIALVRNNMDVQVCITHFEIEELISLADYCLDFFELDGALFMRGLKPKTKAFNVQEAAVEGRRHVRFTPLV